MHNTYHILNGDALAAQFPNEITGEKIIIRECLMDGPVHTPTMEVFYEKRVAFLSNTFEPITASEYQEKSVAEFEKIKTIPPNSNIYLWFEQDVFCQVNCWFVIHLIESHLSRVNVALVITDEASPYSFAHYSPSQLVDLHNRSLLITALKPWSLLWELYADEKFFELQAQARQMQSAFPFLQPVAEALMDRIPTERMPGRPAAVLQEIVRELDSHEFGTIFREFCKRAPIYGYGDLQVRALLSAMD